MSQLTQDQLDFYETNGYLAIEDAVTPLQLAMLRGISYSLIDRSRPLTVSNEVYDLDADHCAENPRLKRINLLHLQDRVYMDMLRNSAMTDILTDLLGADVVLQRCKLSTLSPGGDMGVVWHQDWALAPHTNDSVLAFGLLLEDMDENSGPLRVIPGSHKGPILPHTENGAFRGKICDSDYQADLSHSVPLTGKAGTLTVHHCRTIHGSQANGAEHSRLVLYYECSAADSWPLAGSKSYFHRLPQHELWKDLKLRVVAGKPCVTPRMTHLPVRLPLPPSSELLPSSKPHKVEDPDCFCAA